MQASSAAPDVQGLIEQVDLVFDHAFIHSDPHELARTDFRALGLTVEFERRHHGQGTSNRLMLFAENYLEFLFLADAREASENPMRFDQRFAGAARGTASPWGVCLRGRLPPTERFVPYDVPGANFRVQVWEASFRDQRLPLLFIYEADLCSPRGPQSWPGLPERLLLHACKANGIASLDIPFPDDATWPAFLSGLRGPTIRPAPIASRGVVTVAPCTTPFVQQVGAAQLRAQ